ncbi:hypothetical protein [Desmospora activa]|uniref:hypothetical protein n=1 Tax=Desmospora activa TaxID=500615 RepID=UPI001475BDED|nr:hypothetical protein [Desmospora activa]
MANEYQLEKATTIAVKAAQAAGSMARERFSTQIAGRGWRFGNRDAGKAVSDRLPPA